MTSRQFNFDPRHDLILTTLSKSLGVSMVDVMRRALEALEEKEAARERVMMGRSND